MLSLIAFWQARSVATTLANDQLVEIHGRIDQRLSDLLSMPARINRIMAQMIDDGRLDLTDLRSWRGYLYVQAMAFEMLSGVLWGSAEGEVVWMFRYPGKEGYEFGIKDDATGDEVLEYRMNGKDAMSPEPVGHYVFDPCARPWYRDAVRAGKAGWTEYAWVNEDGSEVTYGQAYPQPYYDAGGKLLKSATSTATTRTPRIAGRATPGCSERHPGVTTTPEARLLICRAVYPLGSESGIHRTLHSENAPVFGIQPACLHGYGSNYRLATPIEMVSAEGRPKSTFGTQVFPASQTVFGPHRGNRVCGCYLWPLRFGPHAATRFLDFVSKVGPACRAGS